jgi:hypothetical protein
VPTTLNGIDGVYGYAVNGRFHEGPGRLHRFVEELPGANTQGDTPEEARENLKEAVALVLEVNLLSVAQRSKVFRPVQ